ncbi:MULTISPECIES: molybdenum cofactor biosynthesis protein B [unclassified Halomonas]|uniref:molybdenum cofactor biosynthesis protein B n=1 Tax=unclassified Halomonas TaxID=2609666 RepID=UPI0028858D5C|nr:MULTISPECIES: molybdenum cofactor biosynthesis protein B [unclassified Halomonas]MDT0500068.1 molybdenum cofactor biosynthesis protein B [Halomonas sp. PAR7]MDT0591106.1 molybdenum cofactor biosynthesis protein B [Halomonas sp. PAR8]
MSHVSANTPFAPLGIAVLTVSDTRGFAEDGSGDLLSARLTDAGHTLVERCIVPDNIYRIRAVVSKWVVRDDIQVVLVNGGTGFTTRDTTPEALAPLFDKAVDGYGELFRHLSLATIGTSTIQSRAVAGLIDRTLVFAMPGSPRACATAWDGILLEQLDARTRPCNFVAMVLPRASSCASRQPETAPGEALSETQSGEEIGA